jgi:colicin import membrane protein
MSNYSKAKRDKAGVTNSLMNFTRGFCAALILGALVPPLWAQGATLAESRSVATRYPAGSITSEQMADRALADARQARTEIETRFINEQQACHPKFFVTSCVDQAKERRRQALAQLRPIEIEANTFKRKARVEARDQTLENKRKQEPADKADQTQDQAPTEKAVAQVDDVKDAKKSEEGRKAQAKTLPDRQARHQSKLKRTQEEEAADAQKRAENIVAYDKKVQAAEARQKEVADRKAEKERKRKMKEVPPPSSATVSTE